MRASTTSRAPTKRDSAPRAASRWCSTAGITASTTPCAARSSSRSTTPTATASTSWSGAARPMACAPRCSDATRLHELEPHVAGDAALHVLDTGIVDYADVCRALGGGDRARRSVHPRRLCRGLRFGDLVGSRDRDDVGPDRGPAGRHLRRSPRRRGRPRDQRARGRRRAARDRVPRRVPRDRAVAHRPRARSRLPGARPAVPVPRRAPHARHSTATCTSARTRCSRSPARATNGDSSTPGTCATRSRFRGSAGSRRDNWRFGVDEMARSLSRRRFTAAVRRLLPEIERTDLAPAPSGVRAQAIGADGEPWSTTSRSAPSAVRCTC